MDSFRPSSCLLFTIPNWNLNATVWTNGSRGQLTQNHLTDCERIFTYVRFFAVAAMLIFSVKTSEHNQGYC
jgi:hypothetical protein